MYHVPLPAPMPIFYLGKMVGVLNTERVFVARRRQEHIFRKFNGLGMSHGLLTQLKSYNCQRIVLILEGEDGTRTPFNATIEMFISEGHYWKDNYADAQHILDFNKMNQTKLSEMIDTESKISEEGVE